MTEFRDIDDFISDIETPEFNAIVRGKTTLELNPDALEEREEEITIRDVEEDAARFFNEEVEFTEEDVVVTQISGRKVEY